MRYITPRKAAAGLGSARNGTADHWAMTVSSWALLILTPLFLLVIGCSIGLPREELAVHFGRPFPALITALFLTVGMVHYIKGSRVMIDDYLRDGPRKAAVIASVLFGWTVIAAALFALAKMAFTTFAI